MHSTRKGRAKLVVLLVSAALVVIGVLGFLIAHMTHMHQDSQVSSGSPASTSGSGAVIFGRFFTVYKSVIYVTSGSGKLLAIHSDNGAFSRSYTVGDGRTLVQPAIADGILYESDLNTLYALRVSDGSVVWHTAFGHQLAISSPSIADQIVYISTSAVDHQVYALRASNGTVIWHYQTRGANEEVGSMIIANGNVYFGSSDGNIQHVYALDAKNGQLLWSQKFTESNGPGLRANDKVIFVFAGNAIFALKADSGTLLWTYRVDPGISMETSGIAGNSLYTLGNNGYVYAQRIGDGKLQWSSKIAAHASSASSLISMNGMIFVASFGGFNIPGNNPKTAGGNLYALRTDNGHIIWQKTFGSNVIPIMAADNGIIYLTSLTTPNDTLYALRPDDGSTIWNKILNGK